MCRCSCQCQCQSLWLSAGSLSRLVHDEGLTIPQLGQIWINISHLANSVPQLEQFVRQVTKLVAGLSPSPADSVWCRTGSEGTSTVRLYGGSTFKV